MSILRPNSIMATSGDNLTKPGLMTSVALGGASCVFTVNVSVRSQVRGDCPVVSRRAPIWAEGEAARREGGKEQPGEAAAKAEIASALKAEVAEHEAALKMKDEEHAEAIARGC